MSPVQQNKLTILVKRFLDLTRILFLALAVIWPVFILVGGISISADPEKHKPDVNIFLKFRVNTEAITKLPTRAENKGELLLSGRGEVRLNNTRSQLSWYLSSAILEIMLFFFLYGLLKMRKLFTSLAEGNTFTQKNAERIRKIGYAFIGYHTVYPVLQYFGSRIMLGDIALNVPGIQLYPAFELNIGGVFAGLAIIVLSGVLREAVSIHQEQELTI